MSDGFSWRRVARSGSRRARRARRFWAGVALVGAGASLTLAGPASARAQGGAGADGGGAQAASATVSAALALATFDTAWARIDRTYFDTAFLAHRWPVLRDSLRPLAATATTTSQLRGVLQALLSSVGVSHFGLIPREASPPLPTAETPADAADAPASRGQPGNAGMALRAAGADIIVWKVDTGGPAWRAGIRPGSRVERIGASAVSEGLHAFGAIENPSVRREAVRTAVTRANSLLNGGAGDSVTIVLGAGDSLRTVRIERAPVRGQMLRFGNLPPLNAVVDVSELHTAPRHGTAGGGAGAHGRVGVIAFSVWLPMVAEELNRAFDRFRDSDGLVIDLRGNPGGAAGMVSGIAGQVLDSTLLIGTLTQRTQVLRLIANPRRVSAGPDVRPIRPYAGPVAILLDPLSGSTSEFFAAGLQGLGRARVFGEPSAGAALPALMERLPNGDVMMYVVADLTDSRGRRVEGVGVIPDVHIPLDPLVLRDGRDPALEAALAWIAEQRKVHH